MKRTSELVYVAAWVMSLNNEDDRSQTGNKWDPPAKMKQFGFLIGQWQGRAFVTTESSSVEKECTVVWSASNLLDGWAIHDKIEIHSASGNLLSKSTLLRTYSEDLNQWKIVKLDVPDQIITEYRSQRVGDSMVMQRIEDSEFDGQQVRFVYYDIYRDSFKMRMESSTDGITWRSAGVRFVLKRK